MEKITLNTRMCYVVMASLAFLIATSCTKDTTEDSLYETQAKRTFSPTEKPVVDKTKVRVKPEHGSDEIIVIDSNH